MAARSDSVGARPRRVAFLGPLGTFTEQALLTQADVADAELVPFPTFSEVLDAVSSGAVDLGFIAIENSIEGTVNIAQDSLAFVHDLLIQREVVLDIHQSLMALPGVPLADIRKVVSIPVAIAQCRAFLDRELPGVAFMQATSTAEAARLLAETGLRDAAAIAPELAAKLYGLDVLVPAIEDHEGNQTRFVLVGRQDAGIPAPTGHDKTTVVVYQRANAPGSLISILQEFAARRINLSKLESRPTKSGGLGDYCFVIDMDGHVTDELVADCLRDLHVKQGGVKFLGSYPAAGSAGEAVRATADERWRQADDWVETLRASVRP
jgi:prephenate dehydratase